MRVHTTKGYVIGEEQDSGVTVFKGIPYAAPPKGSLRWAPPQEHATWDPDDRVCKEFGPACPQPVFDSLEGAEPVETMSEDCLYLNVWTTGEGNRDKPVMVWIHGGAFQVGEGSSRMYDGTALAQMGAVVVTFNYRLGHLGFFAHPALGTAAPANFGLLDQIAVLKWVRDNIAGFGGNRSNVTIFGQSAGASSVLALFAASDAKDLFHKGIAQSAYAIPEYRRDQATQLCQFVASKVWGLGDNATLAQLRAVDEEMFTRKEFNFEGKTVPVPSLAPVAIVDNVVLKNKVRRVFAAQGEHAAKLMIGSNSDEQSVLRAFKIDPRLVFEFLDETTVQTLKDHYAAEGEIDDFDDLERFGGVILRDMLFTMQGRWIAAHHAAKLTAASYWYYFSYVPENLHDDQPHGVPHGGEIVFPFQTGELTQDPDKPENEFTDRDKTMAARISEYWFTFARDGAPRCQSSPVPAWPKVAVANAVVLKLGDTIATQERFRKPQLDMYVIGYPTFEQNFEAQRPPLPQSTKR